MLTHKEYNAFMKELWKNAKEGCVLIPYTKGMIDVKTAGQILKTYVVEE